MMPIAKGALKSAPDAKTTNNRLAIIILQPFQKIITGDEIRN
jgi:hypothetical protein